MTAQRDPEPLMARWPIGSCPECYDAGTPERPLCAQHGHDLTTSGVTLCDPHAHAGRALDMAGPDYRDAETQAERSGAVIVWIAAGVLFWVGVAVVVWLVLR